MNERPKARSIVRAVAHNAMMLILTILVMLAIILTFLNPAHAEPQRISLLVGSHHTVEGDFNEDNLGLFVSWDNVSVGAYKNSFSKTSVAATYDWHLNDHVSLFAGAAYYPGNGENFLIHAGDIIPVVGARVIYGNVFVQAMPEVISFGLTWEVN